MALKPEAIPPGLIAALDRRLFGQTKALLGLANLFLERT
jgi:hypothetical protein